MSTETEPIDLHDVAPQPETVTITTQSLRVLLELAQQAPIQAQAGQLAQMASVIQPALDEVHSLLK
jgi:hypothetical protein